MVNTHSILWSLLDGQQQFADCDILFIMSYTVQYLLISTISYLKHTHTITDFQLSFYPVLWQRWGWQPTLCWCTVKKQLTHWPLSHHCWRSQTQSYKLDVVCQAALMVESSSGCCGLFQQATDNFALVVVSICSWWRSCQLLCFFLCLQCSSTYRELHVIPGLHPADCQTDLAVEMHNRSNRRSRTEKFKVYEIQKMTPAISTQPSIMPVRKWRGRCRTGNYKLQKWIPYVCQLETQINSLHQGLHCKSVGVVQNHWATRKAEYPELNANLHLAVTGPQTSQVILCFSQCLQENNYASHITEHSVKHILSLRQWGKSSQIYIMTWSLCHFTVTVRKMLSQSLETFVILFFHKYAPNPMKTFQKVCRHRQTADHYKNNIFNRAGGKEYQNNSI